MPGRAARPAWSSDPPSARRCPWPCSRAWSRWRSRWARAWVVSPDRPQNADATWIPDPGGGQGAAVAAALLEIGAGPALVVNADLPTLAAEDLLILDAAIPERGIAIAAAPDGTTNALGLSDVSFSSPSTAKRAPRASGRTPSARASPPSTLCVRAPVRRGHAGRPGDRVKVVVLSGGVGGARFVQGIVAAVEPSDVTVVGNVGDDLEVLGLHVSPDLDSILYALAGLNDEQRGWGRADETWRALESVRSLGGEGWFELAIRNLRKGHRRLLESHLPLQPRVRALLSRRRQHTSGRHAELRRSERARHRRMLQGHRRDRDVRA